MSSAEQIQATLEEVSDHVAAATTARFLRDVAKHFQKCPTATIPRGDVVAILEDAASDLEATVNRDLIQLIDLPAAGQEVH